VTTADVSGQDFAAAQASSCHSIRGQVTSSDNPGVGVKNIDVEIKDSNGNTFHKVTDAQGSYEFHFLLTGTYTITASYCAFGCATIIPATRTVTLAKVDVTGQDFVYYGF